MIAPALVAPWDRLIRRLVAEYRLALGEDLVSLALFGSVARGEAGLESDVDLYVVTRSGIPLVLNPRLATLRRRIRESGEYVELAAAGYRPDPRPIFHTVAQLTLHPWILLDISHHGIVLHDPERILDRELETVRRRLVELGARRHERPDGTWYWDLKPDWRPGDVIEL